MTDWASNRVTFFTDKGSLLAFAAAFGILFPMFFTLSGGIYRTQATITDSGGVISTLPLPISIITCVLAFALVFLKIHKAKTALVMVIGTLGCLLLSVVIGGDGTTPVSRKLLMVVQVMLPMMGLLIGQLITDNGRSVSTAFLLILTTIVPLQMFIPLVNSPWLNPDTLISDQLIFFTIYSHIQYVTLIMVAAYAFALGTLWEGKTRWWLSALMCAVFLYSLRSHSYLTMAAFCLVMFAFVLQRSVAMGWGVRKPMALLVLCLVCVVSVVTHFGNSVNGQGWLWKNTNSAYGKIAPLLQGTIPGNVQERFGDWQLFGQRIVSSPKTLLVGHPEPMPREIRSSPHNYYIDITHTFGLAGLLPILIFIAYTAGLCWTHRRSISPKIWWLAGIVFYLVVIDSNFKVTLRQPYPGIFAFFMWGLLLSRLNELKSPASVERPG